MRPRLEPGTTAGDLAAPASPRSAGVRIRTLSGLDELRTASELLDALWGTEGADPYLAPSLLRAMTHAGNYCAGAFDGRELVGAVVGFLGLGGDGPYLHSHILGVTPSHRGADVGYALKLHQRDWARDHGLERITWTFDPLVSRNAHFNLAKLGATAAAYLENFYGAMDDGINGDDESDRLLIEWTLTATPAAPAHAEDAPIALDEEAGVAREPWGPRIRCAVPADIVELRRTDPGAAQRWRRGLRDTLGAAMRRGYLVRGFARSPRGGGSYVLERA